MLRKSINSRLTMFFLISMMFFMNLTSVALAKGYKEQVDHQKNKRIQVIAAAKKVASTKTKYSIDQLTKAVLENNISLARKIIKSNSVDINTKDSKGKYPLEMVLVMNNCDMAKILLKAGADPYVITSDGKTIYDVVMDGESKSLKKIFKKYKKQKS